MRKMHLFDPETQKVIPGLRPKWIIPELQGNMKWHEKLITHWKV
jgi:hypothetical protein